MERNKIIRSVVAYILLGIGILCFIGLVFSLILTYELRKDPHDEQAAFGFAVGIIIAIFASAGCGMGMLFTNVPSFVLLHTTLKGTPKIKKVIDMIILTINLLLMVYSFGMFIYCIFC